MNVMGTWGTSLKESGERDLAYRQWVLGGRGFPRSSESKESCLQCRRDLDLILY